MKSLTRLVSSIPSIICLGVAGAILYSNMSCASMTRAQKTALVGHGLNILSSINTPNDNKKEVIITKDIMRKSGEIITNQAQMQHDLEVAGAGRNQIIINNNPPNYQNKNYNSQKNSRSKGSSTPIGFFMYQKWVDFNNNGLKNGDEFIGFNESVYDIRNLNRIWFSFYSGKDRRYNGQTLSLKVYNLEDGKVIDLDYLDKICVSSEIQNFPCESIYFSKGGKYKAVLNTTNNKSFSLNFSIIK